MLLLMLCGSGYRYRCIDRPFNEYAWGERPAMSENGLALHYVSPADGAINRLDSDTLKWSITGAKGTVDYDVYFGTSNPPDLRVTDTTGTAFVVTVNYDSTYYWRVVAVDDEDSIVGAVQTFTGTVSDPRLITELGDFWRADTLVYAQNHDASGDTTIYQGAPLRRWQSLTSDTSWFESQLAQSPLWDTTTVKGKGIKFDGINDWLTLTKPTYTGTANWWTYADTTLSWFMVFWEGDIPSSNYTVILWNRNGDSGNSWAQMIDLTVNARMYQTPTGYATVANQYADSTMYWIAMSMSSADSTRTHLNGTHIHSFGLLKNTTTRGYPLSMFGSTSLYYNKGVVYSVGFARKHWTAADLKLLKAWVLRTYGF